MYRTNKLCVLIKVWIVEVSDFNRDLRDLNLYNL